MQGFSHTNKSRCPACSVNMKHAPLEDNCCSASNVPQGRHGASTLTGEKEGAPVPEEARMTMELVEAPAGVVADAPSAGPRR